MKSNLSPALEDYLRAIIDLSDEEQIGVRISDIARRLNIAKPSVIQAISDLKKKGLVTQKPYSPVYLTSEGLNKAREVSYRHDIIRTFLEKNLAVSPFIADQDACRIEHIISDETFNNMEQSLRESALEGQERQTQVSEALTLERLRPGQKALVKKIQVQESNLRRRLLDMGVVPGAEVLVERVAPLGDPIEVEIKGFHLSLRRSEAAAVVIQET